MEPKIRAGGVEIVEEGGVSPEKRREILDEIERIVARERTPVPRSAFELKAPKSGIVLPLIVNAALALLTVAVIVVAARVFSVRQNRLTSEAATFLSTEGRLVDVIRRDAEERLKSKDVQIAGIQVELERLDRERDLLASSMEDRVGEREEELRSEMQALLEEERKRLQGEGVQSAEVERQLRELLSQKTAEQARELDVYRATVAAEAKAREEELRRARELAAENLRKADTERSLLAETRQGAEQARAGFESERLLMKQQVSAAERRLKELEESQRREQLVMDQILAFYTTVIDHISASRYDAARQELARFRRFLTEPALDGFPGVNRRKQTDLFLVAALQAIVAPEYFDALKSREVLASIEQKVSAAEQRNRSGDGEGARKLYTEALGMVAAISSAVAALAGADSAERASLLEQAAERDRSAAAAESEKERQLAALKEAASARERTAAQEVAESGRASEDLAAELHMSVAEITRFEAAATELTAGYRAGLGRAERLLAADRPDAARAQAALADAFRSETAARLFPGLPELLARLSRSLENAARGDAYSAGYRAAMDDVTDYATYVGSAEGSEEARSRLLGKVESDPSFRAAVGELQVLLGRSDADIRFVEPTATLLGSVASVAGDRVVVETLARAPASVGARVELRRSAGSGRDETVGSGTVESTEGERTTVKLERAADGSMPRARISDAVYLVAR